MTDACLRCAHKPHDPGECTARYRVTFERGEPGDSCLCEWDDMAWADGIMPNMAAGHEHWDET